ncbi:putative membrane protein (plasmid) [Clostridium botulinum]|uniref:Putative membrane protein n=1 Tax=Clostridium botulinum TaxID=1491 RepID=A0A1L7JN82_CLOBO|nr:putative membrane protein [Clostridium botulinum]
MLFLVEEDEELLSLEGERLLFSSKTILGLLVVLLVSILIGSLDFNIIAPIIEIKATIIPIINNTLIYFYF